MPSVNAQADVVLDWKGLLDSVTTSPDLRPLVEAECQTLEKNLTEFLSLKARQEELTAQRQETTQQLKEVMARGREVAVGIRSVLRGKVGPWNERVVQFRIAPIRRRSRPVVVLESEKKKPADGGRTETVVEIPTPAGPVA